MDYSSEALFLELVEDLGPYLCRDYGGDGDTFIKGVSELPIDCSLATVKATSLFGSFYKKLADEVNDDAEDIALQDYLACNSTCREWKVPEFATEYERELWGTFKREVHRFFQSGEYQSSHLAQPRHYGSMLVGPGSNTGCRGYDYYTKLYDSPLSVTSRGLYRLYREYRAYVYGPLDPAEQKRLDMWGMAYVQGETLSFVPKNKETARTIGTQPTVNMFFQKMSCEALELRLKEAFGLDLSDQPDFNRALAKLGSMRLGFDTTDLKQASNGLSVRFLQEVLEPDSYGELAKSRCEKVLLPDGSWVDLHIFSAMGNGYTFPLQTALFACMVAAAYRMRGLVASFRPKTTIDLVNNRVNVEQPNCAVFGDDIITRREATSDVHTLLRLSGFTVNTTKTFVDGPFRESCGFDYWNGSNVRGVYVKTLRTQQSRAVAFNRLLLWSAKTKIPLPKTLAYLYGWTKAVGGFCPMVPLWENDDSGIKCSYSTLLAVCSRIGVNICRDGNGSTRYSAWQNQTRKLQILEDDIVTPKGNKNVRTFNPDGLWDSFFSGTIRAGKIVLRSPTQEASYRLSMKTTPNWERPAAAGALLGDIEQRVLYKGQRENVNLELDVWHGRDFVAAWKEARTQPWDITPVEVSWITSIHPV